MPQHRVRRLNLGDFLDAHALYKELVGDIPVPDGAEGEARFADILRHPGTMIFGTELGSRITAMATLHLLPNMTQAGRPYALVENVVTLRSFRKQGLGRAVLETIIDQAWSAEAYKIMLLTGRELGAKGFYEALGFTSDEKHGMTLRRGPRRNPVG